MFCHEKCFHMLLGDLTRVKKASCKRGMKSSRLSRPRAGYVHMRVLRDRFSDAGAFNIL